MRKPWPPPTFCARCSPPRARRATRRSRRASGARRPSAFAEVTSDTLGTSFARVRAGDGAPTLALVGHIDEIGVAITNIEENGLLSFTTIGGIAPETLHRPARSSS